METNETPLDPPLQFFNDLQAEIGLASPDNPLKVMGGFNAIVGWGKDTRTDP